MCAVHFALLPETDNRWMKVLVFVYFFKSKMLFLTQISIFSGDKLSLSFLICFYQWYFKGACGMRYSAIFQDCPWFPGKVPRLKVRYLFSEFSGWWVLSSHFMSELSSLQLGYFFNCSHQLVKVA